MFTEAAALPKHMRGGPGSRLQALETSPLLPQLPPSLWSHMQKARPPLLGQQSCQYSAKRVRDQEGHANVSQGCFLPAGSRVMGEAEDTTTPSGAWDSWV